jgi:dephospho-CoA kinase
LGLKIGLTGNIGCGKSSVGAILRELGADYVDADQLVHQLLGPGTPVVQQVLDRFGPQVLGPDGGVNRDRLGEIVFRDPTALRDLEALLHPRVRADLRRRMARSTAAAIVVDAIKLIESGLHKEVDSVWLVACGPDDQRRRLTELRGLSSDEAEARMAAQSPQEERLPFANVVIDNRGSLEATRQQVLEAWQRLVGANIGAVP